jgi:hypothetical protein
MRVLIEETPESREWDVLAASLGGGYFHCSAETLFHSSGPGKRPVFIKGIDDSGECIGIITGTIVPSQVWPFSRHCGYAMLLALPAMVDASEDDCAGFLQAVERRLSRHGVFNVRIYSHDSLNSHVVLSKLGYRLAERQEFVIDLGPSLDEIWTRLKGTRRTDIRKAEKLGVETRLENTVEALRRVLEFQSGSLTRHGIDQQCDLDAERERLESGCLDLFVSYRNKAPLNAAAFGVFNDRPYYHLSGTSDEGYKCSGPAHLLWTAVKTYKERGARRLNLGAALPGQEGVAAFKQDFGAAAFSSPIGVKRISKIGSALHWARTTVRR